MARSKHYSPEIRRFLVSALYHESKGRGVPMTVLTNQIIQRSLEGTEGWRKAQEAVALKETAPQKS